MAEGWSWPLAHARGKCWSDSWSYTVDMEEPSSPFSSNRDTTIYTMPLLNWEDISSSVSYIPGSYRTLSDYPTVRGLNYDKNRAKQDI